MVYELLTGRRAFHGPTSSDTIAAILERPPDWTALPSTTPATVRRLLAHCLEKDVRRRLELDEPLSTSRPMPRVPPAGRPVVMSSSMAD